MSIKSLSYLAARKIIKFFTYFFIAAGAVFTIFSVFDSSILPGGIIFLVSGFLYSLSLVWIGDVLAVDKVLRFYVITFSFIGSFFICVPVASKMLKIGYINPIYLFSAGGTLLVASFLYTYSLGKMMGSNRT